MARALMLDSRRYSAVIVRHDALAGHPSARNKLWEALTGDWVESATKVGEWLVSPAAHLTNANYYSVAAASADSLTTSSGFVQGLYLATPLTVWPVAEPYLLIAAPYVRLLSRALHDFEELAGQPRPSYLRPRLDQAFKDLANPPESWAHVSRFSVVNREEPSVDRVSIAGRNPLRAAVGKAFIGASLPFDIRLESKVHSAFRTNVNLDRHGNIWWYQRSIDSFLNVLPVLDLLYKRALFDSTRTLPTSRRAEEDD